jgi:hypothetical protein
VSPSTSEAMASSQPAVCLVDEMLRMERQISRVRPRPRLRSEPARPSTTAQVAEEFASVAQQRWEGLTVTEDSKLESPHGEPSWLELDDRLRYLQGKASRGVKLRTDFTWEAWRRMLAAFGWACAYCGSQDEIGQDHVVPVSRGGQDLMSNILPACACCNRAKGHRELVPWLNALGRDKAIAAFERIRRGKREYGRRG